MGVEYVPSEAERASNINRNEAEAKSALAEAKLFTADARRNTAFAETAEIDLRKKRREEKDELAKHGHFHTYLLNGEIGAALTNGAIQQFSVWQRQDPGCDITINMNSPGGSIIDGFALIDFLRGLRVGGPDVPPHKVTINALGMCASMAGVILQAADHRVIGANAVYLIHEGSFGASGDYANVKDRVELMEILHARILDLYAERSTLSRVQIKHRWTRKDWWFTAEDALKHGFVDEVK